VDVCVCLPVFLSANLIAVAVEADAVRRAVTAAAAAVQLAGKGLVLVAESAKELYKRMSK